MNKIKQIMLSAMLVLSLGVAVMPAAAYADAKSDACNAIGAGSDCSSTNGGTDVSKIIRLTVNILSVVAGIVAVIMIIVGGFKFMTSGGDSNKTAGARNTIVYALIGLVIVALSQVLVKFVLDKLK